MADPLASAPTVLYLAFDACDAGIMQRLARDGRCPHLASLLADGAVVDTIAPYGTFVGSSWMTITTGDEVGSHGFHNWAVVDPETYAVRGTSPRDARGTPFWQRLSDAGRRVAVIDVPHADLPRHLNGIVLKEWGCHDRHHGTASYPPQVLEELDQLVGRHAYGGMAPPYGDDQFAPCDYTLRAGEHRRLDEERQLHEAILGGLHAKEALSLTLLDRGGWDLFLSVFGESHCVGHQLWHVHDEEHPRHDPAARALLGDPVEQVYERLDAALGAHLARAGEATTVYLQMNHGMGPHYDGAHLLDEVLFRLDGGLAERPPLGWRTQLARWATAPLPGPGRRLAGRAAAAGIRRRVATAPAALSSRIGPRADRRFFPVEGNTTIGAIRCNVVGRESRGLVRPGPELDEVCEQLREGLLALVNVDTGRPAVRAVVRADEVLERSPGDHFPDLFVEWERSAPLEQVWSPQIGTVAARYEHWRTGDHNDRGLFVARGPGIAAGRRSAPMPLYDVAPTVAAALGVTLDGVDGRPHPDLVAGGGAAGAPARRLPAMAPDRPLRWRRRAARPSVDVSPGALHLADAAARRAEAAERAAAELAAQVAALRSQDVAHLSQRVQLLERERLVWTTMAWLAHVEVPEDVLISVITPTHERPEKLRRAIESVRAQRYGRWEMVVVDDGGDSAKSIVAEVGDERIRAFAIAHGGACAARNAALDHARGDVITYLDDDNVLDPGWLHAVAWAFQNHADEQVLYGARMIDDFERVHRRPPGGWPWLQFNPFDRTALEQANFADMGVIAHRAGLPSARFDVDFWECGDWDFFLAITEDTVPLELPAVALCYRTDGDDRLTGQYRGHEQMVREKWARRRVERAGG